MLSYQTIHTVVFFCLYAVAFVATFIFFERVLFLYFSAPAEIKLLLKEVETDSGKAESLYYMFASKLGRGMGVLSSCITASPLLGLLGTVVGIMESFNVMSERGISDITEVSKGIGTALEATALGIAVAVVVLLFYTVVNARISYLKAKVKSELSLI